jgi:flagellar biosynthesis/type III secretory pathway M-ring protein FliF/YscJ
MLCTFINVVVQNDWRLSKSKRTAHFAQLTDDEIAEFEAVVRDAFAEVKNGAT